jgi:hypothetical protein
MTVSMGMLIFAGLGYALEKDEPDTMFYTLPQTLYWAIITMTSTGNLVQFEQDGVKSLLYTFR